MTQTKTIRSTRIDEVSRTETTTTTSPNRPTNKTRANLWNKQFQTDSRDSRPSPASFLLPSTIGIQRRNANSHSENRDPRILWAPAFTISGKFDQPLITEQYKNKQKHLIEKIQRIQIDPKIITNADLSHLTRIGNTRTKLPISFLPHKIEQTRRPLKINEKGPGPANYQHYRDHRRIGESFIYSRQPNVVIHPLIGPHLKRNNDQNEKPMNSHKTLFTETRPFWSTIGTRTVNSRLPNAPISSIHQRYDTTRPDEKTKKQQTFVMPGPAAYPSVDNESGTLRRDKCTVRGVTISPKYGEKQLLTVGPGPAMVDRISMEKGVCFILEQTIDAENKEFFSNNNLMKILVQQYIENNTSFLNVIPLVSVLFYVHTMIEVQIAHQVAIYARVFH